MTTDQQFMQRALELAQLGQGHVSPNPMVGCVIVYEGKIIGEGYHRSYGGPHAEVNAVNSVHDQSLLSKSTVYVTLEPCSHFGKTPPCADLLVRHQVKKVIICNEDPNPLVAGKGIQKLRNAGIPVETGLLKEKGLFLNRRFFTSFEQKRPYVILKWAQTADGLVARKNYDSKWISNARSRQLVHKMRAEEDAILVGKNTAHFDNPALTVRDWYGRNPVRIVLDKSRTLDSELNLFDGEVETLCFTSVSQPNSSKFTCVVQEEITPASILSELHERKIQSLIVEGGSTTLQQFIDAGYWDEARIFTSETLFGEGIAAPVISGGVQETLDVQGDTLQIRFPNK